MSLPIAAAAVVVKVGGSLYDLPDFGVRLRDWLGQLDTHQVLLVPGGGPTIEALRGLDRLHGLGEEAAHWLALRALVVNAHFLNALLPAAVVIESWAPCSALWQRRQIPILDAYAFARADDAESGALPHCWEVTSDAVAARVAAIGGARRLILLKSVDLAKDADWKAAAKRGVVDPWFALTLAVGVQVQTVNLRTWQR